MVKYTSYISKKYSQPLPHAYFAGVLMEGEDGVVAGAEQV